MSGYADIAVFDKDIVCENGKVKIVTGTDEVLQRVRTRLLKIRGEWFLNVNSGVPYYNGQLLGGKNTNYARLIIGAEINGTEGVSEVKVLNIVINPSTKKTSIYAEIAIDGRIYQLTEEI